MKRIINNKVYDTATATKCGEWDNGHEALYRKKTGEFFLHGEGVTMSRYAGHSGSNPSLGEQIIPLSYEKAQEWAENHLSGDEYIGLFGEPEESEELGDLHVRISATKMQKLRQAASQASMSLAKTVEKLIEGLR